MPEREVDFQQDLCYLLRDIIVRRPEFEGIRFESARMEYEVDHGRADIAILKSGGKPFLILETKRKTERAVRRDIDPMSPAVIAQALGYASQSGAPYFATANPGYVAVFRVPNPGEQFRIERHRVFVSPIPGLSQDFGSKLLEIVVKYDRAASDPEKFRLATALDWTFVIRLRSFVDWLTRRAIPAIESRLKSDAALQGAVQRFERESGVQLTPSHLARQMSYILMNKVLFYRVLERKYPGRLQPLTIGEAKSVDAILEGLRLAWQDATDVTGNFEAIFSAGLYDNISLSEQNYDLLGIEEGIQGFITDMGTYELEKLESDVIGHVSERLIEPEERHLLGQFYTPPTVAEFLIRWAIRSSDDVVLDPAVGSGTFLVKAYERLRNLKAESGISIPGEALHRSILSQLYATDVNPFAAHLTAMNLAMRDVRHPVTEMNILERDFFKVSPGAPAYVPYVVRTPQGEKRREIRVPLLNAVVGNPPYTRWLEIPEATREAIQGRLGPMLRDYGLTAVIRGGVETAIYQHFILHGHEFLKEGGRLAMIISNSWLQTDVGVKFGAFLLDHYKVHAVIDLGPRIFEIPLVSTCLLLLERCGKAKDREDHDSIFAYVHEALSVDDLTRILAEPESFADRFLVRRVPQRLLPRDRKWIEVMFGIAELQVKIQQRTIPARQMFDVTRGNVQYCAEKKRGLGANEFFYLTEGTVKIREMEKFVVPTLPSIRYAHHFTFSRKDWDDLRRKGKQAFLLHCRKKRDQLPSAVRAYVEYGETECRTREGVVCSESQACAERARDTRHYSGWYDLGDIRSVEFFSSRYAQYRRRFILAGTPVALDDDFLVFSKKGRAPRGHVRAAAAVLNSTLGQIFIEMWGRTTGGGMVSMEAEHAANLPLPDIHGLSQSSIKELNAAMDGLEAASRSLGGAQTADAVTELDADYDRLDRAAAQAVGLSAKDMKDLKKAWRALLDRRVARASEPSPETVTGAEAMMKFPKSKRREKSTLERHIRSLDEFGGHHGSS